MIIDNNPIKNIKHFAGIFDPTCNYDIERWAMYLQMSRQPRLWPRPDCRWLPEPVEVVR